MIRPAVRAWKRLYWRLRPRLPLRTKVSVFFGVLALVASVSLTVVTYTIARSSLLSERTAESLQNAQGNAIKLLRELRSQDAATSIDGTEGDITVGDWFQANIVPEETGFNQAQLDSETIVTSELASQDAFPPELRAFVGGRRSGMQRFTYDGDRFIGVGLYLAEVDAHYYEAFPLRSTERTLRTLVIALGIGSAGTVGLASAIGIWTSRRLMRPLQRITDAATQIASGDLDTRVAPEHDRDLEPLVNSFNGMADAVQTRIRREERFASDVSHELRSPITALSAATDVLEGRRGELPERTQQAIDVVTTQVRRFDRMVLDLLELSRIDAGAADLHLEPAEIAGMCRRIARRFGFEDLRIDVDPAAPVTLSTDRVRFERILGNLLDNARNHAGGPTRIAIDTAPEPFVDIVVEDAGPGVEASERTRIFERFTRGGASLSRVGTGLGLALVAEHVHALAGEVWVEDRPGGGSRFVVRLPVGSDDDENDAEADR